jgi:hypothetical protein
MRCGIAIKRYDPRRTTLRLQGLPEEEFGCRYIATRTQSEINGPAFPVHGSVKISPDAADLDIRLIRAPGIAGLTGKTVPTPLEFRRKTLHPAHDRGMGQGQATLGHHLDQIPKTQLEAKISPHAEDDDLAFKVPPLEQLIKADRRFRHFSNPLPPSDPYYRSLKICTRALAIILAGCSGPCSGG